MMGRQGQGESQLKAGAEARSATTRAEAGGRSSEFAQGGDVLSSLLFHAESGESVLERESKYLKDIIKELMVQTPGHVAKSPLPGK